jgi:protein TonB
MKMNTAWKIRYNFIGKNMVYPPEARENNEQGKVVVQFVVMKDGLIRDATVVRSVSPTIDKEALRVISIMPPWQPGKQNGRAVNVRFVLPVTFALN